MSSPHSIGGSALPPTASTLLDPGVVLGDVQGAKEAALKSLQSGLKLLATLSAQTAPMNNHGLQELEAPNSKANVNDITLKIGLLQDALNQLMAQVSKTEIKSRMDQMQKENQQQLERFEEQMKKAAEAAKKNAEAEKKGNVFEAVSNWIQAAVSIASAVFTMVTAIGQMAVNPVGAAGLFVASAALIGAAAVQVTLAIDATIVATGGEGFLSEKEKANMKKAAEILGYIALAGAMIGLVGGVVVALGQAGRAAGTLAGQQIGRMAAAKAVARVAAEAFKEYTAPMFKIAAKYALIQQMGKGAVEINSGIGGVAVADIRKDASALAEEADKAAAAAKALEAMIMKLRALIEQLQSELEKMIDEGQQTMNIIFGAIDSSAESMTHVIQSSSA